LIDGRLTRSLSNIREVSAVERLAAEEIITVESSTAGRWGLITSFGVAVIVPAVALIAFRAIVTRRRRRRDLLQALKHESELNAAKDEMISNLSHELRTPLTGIYGFALAMEESGFEDRQLQSEMTNLIIHEASDLSRMVDDLLTAAKAEGDGLHFQEEEVDVAREVREAVTPFQRGAIDINVVVEPGVVLADRLRLRQVLRNLVSNATTHGGPTVTVYGKRTDDRYLLEVVDDGDGVPDHVADRLFERFVHRGEAPLLTGSIGLGLSIVEVLVAGMNGTVSYERREGLTVFTIGLDATEMPGTEFDASPVNHRTQSSGPWWSRGPAPANGSQAQHKSPTPPPMEAMTLFR
jgi:signal transduction histidine kinase